MLVLSRYENETILIGDCVLVKVISVVGGRVKIGIAAPKDVRVIRGEVAEPGFFAPTAIRKTA